MSDVVIRVSSLGKKYRIHHQRKEAYTALRDVIADKARGLFRLDRREAEEQPAVEDFWALKDVSFQVKRGEVIGIIGRNGAGKSTLLKILSRITEPTEGRVELDGRVASLLEVGTGFHPELTGRENIFLNGAILGLTRVEIRRKFDEIVAFAEIEKFLDTPVKRFSSGMYVRLAFAVAAHLESEILVVDEVLAIGDAEFQKKCLGKMGDVSKGGRTVLLVSHNMATIVALSTRAVFLNVGMVGFDGPTAQGIQAYLHKSGDRSGSFVATKLGREQQLLRLEITSLRASEVHISGNPFRLRATLSSRKAVSRGCFSVQVVNENLHPVLHLRAYDHGIFFGQMPGETILECEVPQCSLNVGKYALNVYIHGPPGGEFYEEHEAICPFEVEIHDQVALFDWRPHVCSYIVPEIWKRIA